MTSALDLPPGFTAISLREHGDAHRHACGVAGQSGAGTLVWVRRFDTVEAAVVLEPDEPLCGARRAHFAAMSAVGDALSVHIPPEKPLAFVWPDTITVDGGIIGGCRLGWPAATEETSHPDWLVASFVLRLALPTIRTTASTHPLDVRTSRGTSLDIEGFEMLDAAALISSFARHLMVQFDLWTEKGFQPIGRHFLARLARKPDITQEIADNGDLLVRRTASPGTKECHSLVEALRQPGWLDPNTGDPWL